MHEQVMTVVEQAVNAVKLTAKDFTLAFKLLNKLLMLLVNADVKRFSVLQKMVNLVLQMVSLPSQEKFATDDLCTGDTLATLQ